MSECVHGVPLDTFCDQCPVFAKDIVACLTLDRARAALKENSDE